MKKKPQPRPIELLAPARDLECGKEAILHGADAVYIGAPQFSARAAVGNSVEDIAELCEFAHQFDAKVYVAFNTILYDDELAEAQAIICDLYSVRVDALIIQDVSLLRLDIPPIPLHASTQMDNRTVEQVRFLEQVGLGQVVLARELTIPEIREISQQTTVPLEVFVHGALCVSYSGQCYLSHAMMCRSANRGRCAQPCRLPFRLIDAKGEELHKRAHLLSLKDMNRSEHLEELLDAGVHSLKIEGRLKEIDYVKNVTAYYRLRLDEIIARRSSDYCNASVGRSFPNFTPQLTKSFNRGFTPYLLDLSKLDIASVRSPKSLGEPIGTVKQSRRRNITVRTKATFNNGDGFVYFDPDGDLQGFRANSIEGATLHLARTVNISTGTMLYRNHDQAFEQQLTRPTAVRQVAVSMTLWDHPIGFALEIADESGARAAIQVRHEKQLAQRPQEETIRRQLSRLGDTIFEIEEIRINLSSDWFLPASLLAELRRGAVASLLRTRRIRRAVQLRRKTSSASPAYHRTTLSYLNNVANSEAEMFYRDHDVKQIAPALEKSQTVSFDKPLMFSKHCLKYYIGQCPREQNKEKRKPLSEPLFLEGDGDLRLRLEFDCVACQMKVFRHED